VVTASKADSTEARHGLGPVRGFCIGVFLALAMVAPICAQISQASFQYFYDDLGQLSKVIDSSGNELDYQYDAVGNILSITRGTAPGALAILNFTPQQGGPGATVTIQGQGFSVTANANTVKFSGTPAAVTSATATSLVVTLPGAATTGPISVTVAGQTATSTNSFTVLPLPTITSVAPSSVNVSTTVPSFQVTGTNLTGSTFSFLPAFSPPVVAVTGTSIDPTGATATLSLTIGPNTPGTYVLVAQNSVGGSTAQGSAANSVQVLNPNTDVTPPAATITSPLPGASVIQGQVITIAVNATDNVGVTWVDLSVNGVPTSSLFTAPYNFAYTVPTVGTTLAFQASARDAAGNVGTSSTVSVTVTPDPLTTAAGKVVDSKGNPVAGAAVTTLNHLSGTTASDGTFSIPNVPTIAGNIQAHATFTASDGSILTGASALVAPVGGGTTNVGNVVIEPPETKILLAGGTSDLTNYPGTAEVYDPLAGTWTQTQNQIPNMPPAGGGFCAANMTLLGNGQALFAGGSCSDSGTTTNAASLYNLLTNQWTSAAGMNFGRDQFGMVTLRNGHAFAFAGCAGGCSGPNILGQFISHVGASAESYDFVSNTWTTAGSLNIARGNFGNGNFAQSAVRLMDGRLLACNGSDGGSTSYTTCEIYDPVANKWTNTGAIGEVGAHQFVLLANSLVLTIKNDGIGAMLFDPTSSTWQTTGSLPSARTGGVLTLLSDGRVLLSSSLGADIYDPTTGTWSSTGSLAPRNGHIALLLDDGRVLVAGGANGVALSSAEIFDPGTGTWSTTASMSQARYLANAVALPPTAIATGSVNGIITNVDGSAASNALVTLFTITGAGITPRSIKTNSSGSYVFSGVPVQTAFTLRAFTPDGLSYTDSTGNKINTSGGSVTVDMTLPALATVNVTVLQADGTPASGMRVNIQNSLTPIFRFVALTDGNGVVNIPNVPQGAFTIQAQDPSDLILLGTFTGSIAVTDQGQTMSATITLPPTGNIQGTVLAGDSQTFVVGSFVQILDAASGVVIQQTFSGLGGSYQATKVLAGAQGFIVRTYAAFRSAITVDTPGSFSSMGQTLTINPVLSLTVIKGTVYFGDGVTPYPSPQVAVKDAGNSTLNPNSTDASGHYAVLGAALGNFSVTATDPTSGFSAQGTGTLSAMNVAAIVNLTFPLAGAVTGIVTDTGGNPVPNVSVVLSSTPGRSTATAADGSFVMSDLPTGTFTLTATDPVTGNSSNAPVVIVGGQTTIQNFTLGAGLTGTVEGTIVAGNGVPIPFASVEVFAVGGNFRDFPNTDQSGFYQSTGVVAGTQGFAVQACDFICSTTYGSFTSNGQIVTVNFTLESVIQGTVISGDGVTPLANAFVDITQNNTDFSGTADTNGNYLIFGPPSGAFTVTAQDPISSVTGTNSGVVTDITIPVVVNVTLPPTGTVTGTIFDSNNSPTSAIVGFSSAGPVGNWFNPQISSGADGSYQFIGAPLGNFSVQASQNFIVFGAASGSLNVNGSTAVANVSLATGTITGTILAADGQTPIPNANVVIENFANANGPVGGFYFLNTTADNLGNYQATGVEVGNVRVVAYDNNFNLLGFSESQLTPTTPATINVISGGDNFTFGSLTLSGTDGFQYTINCEAELSGGGNPSAGLTGPYSGAYVLEINAITFPCLDFGSLAQNSAEIDLGSVGFGGAVQLTRKVFSPSGGRFTRYLDEITNPTNSAASLTVQVNSNLASGGNTRVVVDPTSTNNTYAVTDNNGMCCQPALAHVFGAAGATLPVSSTQFQNANGSVFYRWEVTIAPGQTVILMHFAVQALDDVGATSEAQALVNLTDPDTLDGMSLTERTQVENFVIQ
jgi:YD repeat-containing protein